MNSTLKNALSRIRIKLRNQKFEVKVKIDIPESNRQNKGMKLKIHSLKLKGKALMLHCGERTF